MYDERFYETQVTNEANYNAIHQENLDLKRYMIALRRQDRLQLMKESKDMKRAWEAMGKEKWKLNMKVRQAERRYKRTYECKKLASRTIQKETFEADLSRTVFDDLDKFNEKLNKENLGQPLLGSTQTLNIEETSELKTILPSTAAARRTFSNTLTSMRNAREIGKNETLSQEKRRQRFLTSRQQEYLQSIEGNLQSRNEQLLNVKANEEAEMDMSYQRFEQYGCIVKNHALFRKRSISNLELHRNSKDWEQAFKFRQSKLEADSLDRLRREENLNAIATARKTDADREAKEVVENTLKHCIDVACRKFTYQDLQEAPIQNIASTSKHESDVISWAVGDVAEQEGSDFILRQNKWVNTKPSSPTFASKLEAMLKSGNPPSIQGSQPEAPFHLSVLGDIPETSSHMIVRKLKITPINPEMMLTSYLCNPQEIEDEELRTRFLCEKSNISDDLLCDLVADKCIQCLSGFILLGFPRTAKQALLLEQKLHSIFSGPSNLHLLQKRHTSSTLIPPPAVDLPKSKSSFHAILKFSPPTNTSPESELHFSSSHQDLIQFYSENFEPVLIDSETEPIAKTISDLMEGVYHSPKEETEVDVPNDTEEEVVEDDPPEEETQKEITEEELELIKEKEKQKIETKKLLAETWIQFEDEYKQSAKNAVKHLEEFETQRLSYISKTTKEFRNHLQRTDGKSETIAEFREKFNAKEEVDLGELIDNLSNQIQQKDDENQEEISKVREASFGSDMRKIVARCCAELAALELKRFELATDLLSRYDKLESEGEIIDAGAFTELDMEQADEDISKILQVIRKVQDTRGFDEEHARFCGMIDVIEKVFNELSEWIQSSVDSLVSTLESEAQKRKETETSSLTSFQAHIQIHIDANAILHFPITFQLYWVVDRSSLIESKEPSLLYLVEILRVEYAVGISEIVFDAVCALFPEIPLVFSLSLFQVVFSYLLQTEMILPPTPAQFEQMADTETQLSTLKSWIEFDSKVSQTFDILFAPSWEENYENVYVKVLEFLS